MALLKKEITQIKQIKNLGVLDLTIKEKHQVLSTLELLFNSRVKGTVIACLPLADLSNLMLSSKSLYLAIAPPKVIVPHALKLGFRNLHRELNLLRKVEVEYRDILKVPNNEASRYPITKHSNSPC